MNKTILFTTLAACSLLAATPSIAADYSSGIISKDPGKEFTPVEFGSGWYMRADVGYGIDQQLDATFSRAARAGDADASAGSGYSLSFGFGHIFNDNFRSDVTFDYFSSRSWSGSASGCGVDGGGVPYTGDCSSSDSGEYEANALSLNAYFNLLPIGQFSPYLGAGVGVAHVEYSGTTSILRCVVDPGENCDLGAHSGGAATPETLTGLETFPGATTVNLTYTLMAGVDIEIDDYWTADINYRYTSITDDEIISNAAGSSIQFDGAEIHEIRAGLRYELW